MEVILIVLALFVCVPLKVSCDLELAVYNSTSSCFGIMRNLSILGMNVECPSNDVIAINRATIAVKPTLKNCSIDSIEERFTDCCQTIDNDDCVLAGYLGTISSYSDECNGDHTCSGLDVRQVETYRDCEPPQYEEVAVYYMHLNYYCINEAYILSSCQGVILQSPPGGTVYLQSSDFPDGIPGNVNGSFSVETDDCDANITVYIIQRRLNNSPTCTQKLTLAVGISTEPMEWTSDHNTQGIEELTVPDKYLTIHLENNCADTGGNFWFGFKASTTQGNISISCPAAGRTFCGNATPVTIQTPQHVTSPVDTADSDEPIDGKVIAICVLVALLMILLTVLVLCVACRRNIVGITDTDDLKEIKSSEDEDTTTTGKTLNPVQEEDATKTVTSSMENSEKVEHTNEASTEKKQKEKKTNRHKVRKTFASGTLKSGPLRTLQLPNGLHVKSTTAKSSTENVSQRSVESGGEAVITNYNTTRRKGNRENESVKGISPLRRSSRNTSPWRHDSEPFVELKTVMPTVVRTRTNSRRQHKISQSDTVSRSGISSLKSKGRPANLLTREPAKYHVSKHKERSKSVMFSIPKRSASPVNYINQPLIISMQKKQSTKKIKPKRINSIRKIFRDKHKDDTIKSKTLKTATMSGSVLSLENAHSAVKQKDILAAMDTRRGVISLSREKRKCGEIDPTGTAVAVESENVSSLKQTPGSVKLNDNPGVTDTCSDVISLSWEWHNPDQITDAVHLDSITLKPAVKRKVTKKKKIKRVRNTSDRSPRRYSDSEILPILSKWATALGTNRLAYPKENLQYERQTNTAKQAKKRKLAF